ncbi:hypothetical protein HUK84_21020, partial [Nguyenibacter vanlangensis]|nr:hypothetical protein [Nguyenibacter vanlangensis]
MNQNATPAADAYPREGDLPETNLPEGDLNDPALRDRAVRAARGLAPFD